MKKSRGFTLIELLAAMAITIIIMGALFTALWIAFRARTSAERAVNATRVMDLAMETITRDFQMALPQKVATVALAGAFYGDDISLTLFRSQIALNADQPGGIQQVDYLVNNGALVRRVYPNTYALSDNQQTPDDEVVVSNVASVNFVYFDGSDWQSSWDATSTPTAPLPQAIQMTLEYRDDKTLQTTTLVKTFGIPCAVPTYGSGGTSQ